MRLFLTSIAIVATACRSASAPASSPPTTTPAPSTTTEPITRDVFVRATTDMFSPKRGDEAIRSFTPEVSAAEVGGECRLTRTSSSGATMVTAGYPDIAKSNLTLSITFDSAGHVVRYSERRGVPHIGKLSSPAQLDSALRAAEAAMRSTTIMFDYAVDQAFVMNRGGGRPTDAVVGSVRSFERLEKLGPPAARMERMRKLCGV